MARTIKEIADSIKSFFMSLPALQNLYSFTNTDNFDDKFSSVSVEANMANIVATEAAAVEEQFDWHKQETTQKIENERIGKKGWIENIAKRFQFGDELPANSDTYAVIDTSKQVIKAAYAGEGSGGGVYLKVANIVNNEYVALTPEQLASFKVYMKRVKPATGISYVITSDNADQLGVVLDIYYDPLLLKTNGEHILNGNKPVIDAIKSYLSGIGYSGEFITQNMCNLIEAATGVKIVEPKQVSYKHAGYDFVTINAKYTPIAGYIKLDEEDTAHVTINYIPYE
mgnify:CR=1 FL=1